MSFDVNRAVLYNRHAVGRVWRRRDLPESLALHPPDTAAFARAVRALQEAHGLAADGKLGPVTLAHVHAPVPKPQEPSQCLVLRGEQVRVPDEFVAAGFTARNWAADGLHRFFAYARTEKIAHLVIHETVTRTAAAAVKVLSTRKTKSGRTLGTHLVVDPDGNVDCHADLIDDCPLHGNQLNRCSVGVDVVNPYYPKHARPPFGPTIPSRWWTHVPSGDERSYVLPTEKQMSSLRLLLPWAALCAEVPWEFPTLWLNARRRRIDGWDRGVRPPPGVVAHRDYASHADGRWILEQLS